MASRLHRESIGEECQARRTLIAYFQQLQVMYGVYFLLTQVEEVDAAGYPDGWTLEDVVQSLCVQDLAYQMSY